VGTPTPSHQAGIFGSVAASHTNEEVEAATAILSLQQLVVFSEDSADSEATEEDSEITLDDPTVPDNDAAATLMALNQAIPYNDRPDAEEAAEDTTVQDNEATMTLLALRYAVPSNDDLSNRETTVEHTALENTEAVIVFNRDRSDQEASVVGTAVRDADAPATKERRKMTLKEYLAMKKARKNT
jgi:hypothetical protein